MIKRKKLLALTMGLLIGTSTLFTACSTKTSSVGGSGELVNLVYYTIGPPQKDQDMVLEKINEYTKEKINATVTMKSIDWGDYDQKMQVIINSGEEFDICFTADWGNSYLGNSRKGAFVDITEMLEKDSKNLKDAVDPTIWKGATIDGKIYGVPAAGVVGATDMWVFNEELVKKYNVPYEDIHSVESLLPWLKVIKENEPNIIPLYLTNGVKIPVSYDVLIRPLGVSIDNGDLKVENIYETPGLKKDLELIREAYLAGYINQDAAINNDESKKNSKNPWFVMTSQGSPGADQIWGQDFEMGIVSSKIQEVYATNASTTGQLQAISATSKNPEKAMEFLNLMNTDKYLNDLFKYGLEDVHYTKIDDDYIKFTEKRADYSVPAFALGNSLISYKIEGEPENKLDLMKEWNEEAKESPVLGFKFDTNNVSNELASISNVLKEFEPNLSTGSVDSDEYLEKLNKKLKEVGLEKVKAELQSQIDAWKENK